MSKFLLGRFLSVFIASLLIISCSSDDDDDPLEEQPLALARLTDFQLNETDYLTIDISHPTVVNGVETAVGEIDIVIPYKQESLSLSLKAFSLDDDIYSISPAARIPQDFSDGPVTYTISLNESPAKTVHYNVTITHGGEPFFKNAKVTGFKFEKARNAALANDIDAIRIVEYDNYSEHAIYVIVPVGTDFSELVPTITFDAAKLYYSDSKTESSFVLYPTAGEKIDFKYPKSFYLVAENSSGTKSLPYTVIVDVADPIKFDGVVLTDDVTAGTANEFENFFGIAEWTNQGNHPITGMSPTEYEGRVVPDGFPDGITVITASLTNPNAGTNGIAPGEKGRIDVRIRRVPIGGSYESTAVFRPTFSLNTKVISYWPEDHLVEDVFNEQKLTIKTTIVE